MTFDQATSDMVPAVDAAARAHYSETYGMSPPPTPG